MSWKVRVTRLGVELNTTGFPSREAAQQWARSHVVPEDGRVEVVAERQRPAAGGVTWVTPRRAGVC